MRTWFDLTTEEKKQLKEEFNSKNKTKIINIILNVLKIIFYGVACVDFFFFVGIIIVKISNECYDNECELGLIKYGSIFVIFLLMGIICSVIVSNNNKKFNLWLKTKSIIK